MSENDNPNAFSIFTTPDQLTNDLQTHGYAVLDPSGVCELTQSKIVELDALKLRWNDLPLDHYLKDGGRYRRRKHSCFVVNGSYVRQTLHRPLAAAVARRRACHSGIDTIQPTAEGGHRDTLVVTYRADGFLE